MIARRLPFISACQVALLLAVLGPVPFLSGQTAPTPAAAKPKLVPRPLPGMGPSKGASNLSGPSAEDIQETEASARAKVPLFRPTAAGAPNAPATRMPASGTSQAGASAVHSDRARITAVLRRGSFPIPHSKTSQPPVLVNGSTVPSDAVSTETVPAALPPGKIRIIPKEMIKIGTPAPTP